RQARRKRRDRDRRLRQKAESQARRSLHAAHPDRAARHAAGAGHHPRKRRAAEGHHDRPQPRGELVRAARRRGRLRGLRPGGGQRPGPARGGPRAERALPADALAHSRAVQAGSGRADQPAPDVDLRAARAVGDRLAVRHRQHPDPLDLRAHEGARHDAGDRHEPPPDPPDDPLRVGDHGDDRRRPRAARRRDRGGPHHHLRAVGDGLRAVDPGGHARRPARRRGARRHPRRPASGAPRGTPGHAPGDRHRVGKLAAMAAPTDTDEELQAAAWDLEPLVAGEGREGVERRMAEALERARAFAAEHAGKLGSLDGDGLAAAMRELAAIQELVGRAGYYAALRFSTDTADPATGALMQWVQEQETQIQTTLLFFELEWAALPDEDAEAMLAGEGLDFARHHLRNVRRYRDHLLSEPEERIVTEKSLTGSSAWTRLFEEL